MMSVISSCCRHVPLVMRTRTAFSLPRSVLSQDSEFSQQKRDPAPVERRTEFVLACPELHSAVNLSRIVRAFGCFGLSQLLVSGSGKLDTKVSRGAEAQLDIRTCRTLHQRLRRLRSEGYSVVGLEQTAGSVSLDSFSFPLRCVLLLGTEKKGIAPSLLEMCDATVEIPMFGFPRSHNVATAATICMWEYIKQHPPSRLDEPSAIMMEQRAAMDAALRAMYSRRGWRRRARLTSLGESWRKSRLPVTRT